MNKLLIIFAAAAIAIMRFLIVPRLDLPTAEGSYEAFAHMFVGGLFGAWIVTADWKWSRYPWCGDMDCPFVLLPCFNCIWKNWAHRCNNFYFVVAVLISLLELAMFVIQKGAA